MTTTRLSSTQVASATGARTSASPAAAHCVRKDKIAAAAATGRPVVALCGKVWTPGRDPSKYPVCPTCKQIYEQMREGGDSGGKGPRFPRFPFSRGGQ